jgi:hypothetical protein
MKLVPALVASLVVGLLSSSFASATSRYVGDVLVPGESPRGEQLTSSTNMSSGQVLSGVVHWTVQASGQAHAVRFYKDKMLLVEVVADGTSWDFVLDTTTFADGMSWFDYEIYDRAGKKVAAGRSIDVLINNHATSGGAASTVSGGSGSDGTTPTQPPQNQTPPVSLPSPTPPAPVIIRVAAKTKLLVGAYAQTAGRRGRRFASAMFVIRSDNGKQITRGNVTCRLAGAMPVWRGWYHRAASCRWAIRANAKLGRATGWLAVTSKGLTVRRRFTVIIKR